MENQPRPGPARPWLRLASIARPVIPPAPAPGIAPVEPSQPLLQPTLRPMAPPTSPISASAEPATLSSPPPPLPPPPPPPPLPVLAPVPLSEPPPPPPAFIPGPIPDALPFSPVARVSASSFSLPPSPAIKADVGASSLLSPPAIKAASPPPASLPSTANFPVPPSPKPRVSAPTTPLLRSSIIAALARGPVTTPTPSPKLIKTPSKTPYQSPKPKPTAPPPSPLALPPSQLRPDQPEPELKFPSEPDQKTLLLPKSTPEKPVHSTSPVKHHQQADPEVSKKDKETEQMKLRKAVDYENKGMRVITLAGENRGAFMEITTTSNKHENGGHNKQNAYKRGGGHLVSERNGREEKDKKDYNKMPFTTFTNSNVQGVNNSILFNSSCTHHDPGVHLTLSNNPLRPWQPP